MHERIPPRIRVGVDWRAASVGTALLLAGCLDRNGGQIDPTAVEPSTGAGTDSSGSTTFPGIMTTTVDPHPGDSDSDGGSTGEPAPLPCGNGKIDPPEQCDQGEANGDDRECTSACRWNICGDGLVEAGDELCDDGKAKNGTYGHCDKYCDKFAEHCGDGKVQTGDGEVCDDPDPKYGCLPDCTQAASCLAIKAGWGDAAETGLYFLQREGRGLTVWCDMDADGGGYTFLKYASGTVVPDPPDKFIPEALTAAQAEAKCAHWGLRLFSPRSQEHLRAAITAASAAEFGPVSDSGDFPPNIAVDSDAAGYLSIMGIYPVTPGLSCQDRPLNHEDCPQWAAKPHPLTPDVVMPYWVSDKIFAGQPGTSNCAGCSLLYDWNLDVQPPVLTGYFAVPMNGKGASSPHFLCEIGDKLGPPEG
ncbi:hypothetical protein SAMN02745121_06013 [Nannocystis exedens]|uniref:Myxococcus cysteine-rich repeat-containing protein n=1 Tax=Nannocystis exedens TaxID=54 RepID=A0A1I2ECW2_9BACT|nr:fibrinogen-like YCDxxxxGGGW domain-containing protein [Nannocystis exedens]PCC74807.1 lipoprotein [Nannocystis exedens]SFE90507.1 hypothetical protein SAMN02745121_06013 [Nannocystis exedens]